MKKIILLLLVPMLIMPGQIIQGDDKHSTEVGIYFSGGSADPPIPDPNQPESDTSENDALPDTGENHTTTFEIYLGTLLIVSSLGTFGIIFLKKKHRERN